MKLSTVLDKIDSGDIALPEFQRGYVWNRDQVRALFTSLYRKLPVGGLLVWETKSAGAPTRGEAVSGPGMIKLLLDGQQRATTQYGVIRGRPPRFFDGDASAFTGLHFHMQTEEFSFYKPTIMANDPLWVDVSKLFKYGIGPYIAAISAKPGLAPHLSVFLTRLNNLLSIHDREFHVEEVSGDDKSVEVVVDIFNRVNSGGTKLSKGDLALAKICASAGDARERMKTAIRGWKIKGFDFTLDWLLRVVNALINDEARFDAMHRVTPAQFDDGLTEAIARIDLLLNLISGRLGLDHDQVLFSRYAFPVMARYLSGLNRMPTAVERDRLLFWFLHSALWGRYSGSTESYMNRDLERLRTGGLDALIAELRLWRGSLTVEPSHFDAWSTGARFYPLLYMLTRIGAAQDWGLGIPLKAGLHGSLSRLEVHHIFPRSLLYKRDYSKPQVNALGNFCFLTQETNLNISNREPRIYFEEIERDHPGALTSQWIPMDRSLWALDRFPDFLAARRELLSKAANELLDDLRHGLDIESLTKTAPPALVDEASAIPAQAPTTEEEDAALDACNSWTVSKNLPAGTRNHALAVPGAATAPTLDLAWPEGLQPGLSEPIAVLINEPAQVFSLASAQGFRCFDSVAAFKRYVRSTLLTDDEAA